MSGQDELTAEAVQGMKVVQLKGALKERGLPHSGVKRALIARLLTAIEGNSENDSDEEESSQASVNVSQESIEDETSEGAEEPSQEPQDPTSDFDDMEEDVTAEPTETVDNLATSDTDIAPEEPVVAEPPRDPSPEPVREPTPEPELEEPTPVAEPEPEPVAEEPPAPTPPKPAAAPAPVPDLVVAPTPPEPAAAPAPKQAAVPDFPAASKKRAAPEPSYEEPSYVYDEPATVHSYEEPGEASGSQPTKKIKLSSTSTAATTLDRIQQRAQRFGIKIKQPASVAPPAGFGDSSRSSLADQIKSRAARFGTTAAIPKELSGDRMSARQRRFGTKAATSATNGSATISRSGMADKIKSRAARFGTTAAVPKQQLRREPEGEDRMRSRKRRFGSNGSAVQYGNGGIDPALAARQKRFGTTAAPGMTKPSARRAPSGEKAQRVIGRKASMEFEARKRRRMNKFGTEAFSDLPVGIPEENPYVKYVAEAPATLSGPSRASRLNKKSLSSHNEQARMAKRARRFGTGGDLSIKKARKSGYGGEADRMSARKRRFGMD